ncbi:MAG: hypothetical protein OXK73_03405 [Rhodospirillaceae bacterium]|nr:hypothetical protein [Rhodospirillaceae bacterium]
MKAAALLVRGPVLAAAMTASALAADDTPAIVGLLNANGASVTAMGVAGGLEGFRVTPAGSDEAFALFVTASGHAVVGVLYDPQGRLVTADRFDATPRSSGDTRVEAPAAVSGAGPETPRHGFTMGEAGPAVTVWADPACPYSRETVARLAVAALGGRLVLEVVPVALLGPDSAHMALAALDGADAWFDRRTAAPEPSRSERVRSNNAAFAAAGGEAVPLVVWRAAGTEHRHTGAVADVDAFLEGAIE